MVDSLVENKGQAGCQGFHPYIFGLDSPIRTPTRIQLHKGATNGYASGCADWLVDGKDTRVFFTKTRVPWSKDPLLVGVRTGNPDSFLNP
jgi:hypothetical protein